MSFEQMWALLNININIIKVYLQAKESYQRASELEPDDAHLLEALQKADIMERKEAEQHKHKFKRKEIMPSGKEKPLSSKKQKMQPKLSFDDDDI